MGCRCERGGVQALEKIDEIKMDQNKKRLCSTKPHVQ
jgi:hypothetical protein